MYTINANHPHPSIQSVHIPESTGHPFEPGGIAEKEDQFNFSSFHRFKNNYQLSKSRTQKKTIYTLSRQKKQQASRSVCDTATLIDSWLRKAKSEGKDYITTTHANISYEREICLRTSKYLLKRLVDVGFISVQTIQDPSYGRCLYIQYTDQASIVLEALALTSVKQPKQIKRKVRIEDLQGLQTTGCKICTIETVVPYIVRARNKNYITQDNQKDLYLCSGKNIKNVTKIDEEEKKAVSREETYSATTEQPQDRIALKSNEAKSSIDPLSETPTKSPERKDLKKEKPTQPLKLQASNSPQTERAEEELNSIAAKAYEEFLVLFRPEEDKRFECHKTDFIRMVKARTKSHLGCIEDIKTYMRKFSINQYLMGKRLGSNGQFFHPSLYALLSKTIINDYQKGEYSRYFNPYNELDLSKQTEAKEYQDVAVPQELLEKISLALLRANEQNKADPEQTQEILKIITSYAVQKSEKQKLMTQTPERKPNELNPLPVLQSSSGDQATINVANQERAWLKKGESYWQTLDITCRKQWEDDFIATIRRGETGFRVDQDIHDPMFRKFKTVPFMTWIGKILEQEERQENNISPETEIEEIDAIIPDLEEPEDVEFEDFPKEELEQSDSEGLWVTHFQNKSASSYGQNVRRTLHTLLLFASLWQSAQAVEIKSCFTPQQQCLPLIVTELQNAQSEILIQAYSLTSKPISKALREAHDRGVKVKILVDPPQEKSPHSQVGLLKQYGLDVMVDDKVRIAHNKVIVIDGKTLISGSHNFSAAAEKHNAENLLIIKDDPVVQEYRQNWWNRFGKSRVLKMLLRPRL